MIAEGTPIWVIILGLGVGTYLIRFSFLGLIGDRPLPDWLLRHLRYTPVAILPGLVAPMVVAPDLTFAPLTLIVAVATVAVGMWRRNVLWAMAAGITVYLCGLALG